MSGAHRISKGLRVSVIGGSIGGLAAGIALSRAGAEVKVYEKRSTLQDEGTGIGLRPQGVEGLSMLGVKVIKPIEWNWRYGTGNDTGARIRITWRTSLVPYTYARLKSSLEAIASGIDYKRGVRVARVEQSISGVQIEFDDGVEVESDIVVAADGVDSTTRTTLFPSLEVEDTGITLARGFISENKIREVFNPNVLAKFENGNTQLFAASPTGGWWLGHLLPQLADGVDLMFQWIYYFPTTTKERDRLLTDSEGVKQRWGTSRDRTSTETRIRLRKRLASYFPRQLAPLADVGDITIHRCCRMLVPAMTDGRICLVGDAAHITPPWGVGGSSLAIADGVSLASHLGSAGSLEKGLASWSAERITDASSMLAGAAKIQESTLTHPPDLASAAADEVELWVRGFLPPEAHQEFEIYGKDEQPQIFQ